MNGKEPTLGQKASDSNIAHRIDTDEGREEFKRELAHKIDVYRQGRKRWSFIYHSSLYLGAIFGAAAAITPRLSTFMSETVKDDFVSVLAAIGSLIITISTAGGFGRKWNASRTSKGRAEKIRIELIGRNPTLADVTRLAQIEEDHDRAVLGG
jgi:hypothetical protein